LRDFRDRGLSSLADQRPQHAESHTVNAKSLRTVLIESAIRTHVMAEGYIYILFNRAVQNDHYKIGMTTKTPGQRAQEISNATGVPRPFQVLYEQRVSNCREAERLLHEQLRSYRSASNREFFDLPLKIAIKALENVADTVGRLDAERAALEFYRGRVRRGEVACSLG
jgi:hypothetical protein